MVRIGLNYMRLMSILVEFKLGTQKELEELMCALCSLVFASCFVDDLS